MPDCSIQPVLREWSPAIQWILIVAGWWVINKQQNKREKRKEAIAYRDSIQKALDDIEDLAIRFHTGESFDADRMDVLIRKIERLRCHARAVFPAHEEEIDNATRDIRQAITLKNFDSGTFRRQERHSTIINEIRETMDRTAIKINGIVNRDYQI